MGRLTQRASAMWSTVACPRCSAIVNPQTLVSENGSPGERRSFLWLAPRGDFCPHCDFPLSKYFGRIKWIRTMAVGVLTVLAAFVFELAGAVVRFPEWYYAIMRNTIRVGAVVTAIGVIGILVGRKHAGTEPLLRPTPRDTRDQSNDQ